MNPPLPLPYGDRGLQAFRHLYVHVPFCKHKCGYCDFNAYAGMDRLMPDYVDALERELIFARERHPFQQLETVYLGGGTPSLLPAPLMSRLLHFIRANFNVAPDAEVTLEANPASTDEPRVAAWLEGGVNRLSLGVQGFDRRALAVLERRTDAAQATQAFGLARDMGFANISIDLIYAVPFQSLTSWLDTLRRAIALGPDHVSTYCLSFEEGTLLYRRREEGKLPELETDLQWDQLDAACVELEAAGYHRYEVSNWARGGGFESRHNQAYWRCRPASSLSNPAGTAAPCTVRRPSISDSAAVLRRSSSSPSARGAGTAAMYSRGRATFHHRHARPPSVA